MQKVIVKPEGPIDAKLAIVGEAPGETELVKGRPFVGDAGAELDSRLAAADMNRSEFYITNVIKEMPDRLKDFISFSRKGVVTSSEYDKYEQALYDELEIVKPNVVVALGNIPLYALTRRRGILKWRGSILACPYVGRDNLKVIPSIHPSAILRSHQFLWKHWLVRDLSLANKEKEFPSLMLPQRNIRVWPTFAEIMAYLDSVLDSAPCIVAYDIEVMRGELSCISFAKAWNDVIVIPFTRKGVEYFGPEDELIVMRKIAEVLEHSRIKKVGHNVNFDSSFLLGKYGIKARHADDTMVATGVMYPDFPKGLDHVTREWTREPYYKDDGKQYMRLVGSEDDFQVYCGKDSAVCLEAFPKIIKELEREDNLKTYHRQVSLLEPLLFMTGRGIRMDVDGMKKAAADKAEEIEELQERLNSAVGHPINANSSKQVQEHFYLDKGLPPYKKWVREGGRKVEKVTVDEEALIRIARKGYYEAQLILDIRGAIKMKSTYLEAELDPDGRCRSSVNPVGTKNGRLSSSKNIFGRGMNIQNQPHEMRNYFLSDVGYAGYEIDLSQAENRLVAYLAPEPSMLKAFQEGIDIHSLTASFIFNKPISEISRDDGSASLGTGRQSERFWGKKANHALNYGLGYKRFSIKNQLTESEAKKIYDKYHSGYPGVKGSYYAWIRDALRRDRKLVNPFGRARIFLEGWGDDMFRDAYAFLPQSTVADCINGRGVLPIYYNQDKFDLVELLNQVHDSIWFQIPLSVGWEYHARAILTIINQLEKPITWRGDEIVLPADLKIANKGNFGDMDEIKSIDHNLTWLADKIEHSFTEAT